MDACRRRCRDRADIETSQRPGGTAGAAGAAASRRKGGGGGVSDPPGQQGLSAWGDVADGDDGFEFDEMERRTAAELAELERAVGHGPPFSSAELATIERRRAGHAAPLLPSELAELKDLERRARSGAPMTAAERARFQELGGRALAELESRARSGVPLTAAERVRLVEMRHAATVAPLSGSADLFLDIYFWTSLRRMPTADAEGPDPIAG